MHYPHSSGDRQAASETWLAHPINAAYVQCGQSRTSRDAHCVPCGHFRRSRGARKKLRVSIRTSPAEQQSRPLASRSKVITHSVDYGQDDIPISMLGRCPEICRSRCYPRVAVAHETYPEHPSLYVPTEALIWYAVTSQSCYCIGRLIDTHWYPH